MAKKKITEAAPNQSQDKLSPIKRDDNLYKKKINPVVAPKPKLGIDTDSDFYEALIAAAQKNDLDIGKLESFTQISQNRDQVYQLIDTMAEDSTIASILETYTEDSTEPNSDGRVVWAVSEDDRVAKYITYLLDTMNVDKNTYKWMYSLIKYGDLYLRLYRESEYNDQLFDTGNDEDEARHKQSQKINEDLARVMAMDITNDEQSDIISKDEVDDLNEQRVGNSTEILNEDINVKLYSQNDRYVHYIEMIPNPAEVYELTRLGKSYAYIQAPTTVNLNKKNDVMQYNRYSYAFKRKDVNLFEATEFVHAALEDNSSRTPEEVNIFLSDSDYENNNKPLAYKVRRGQSLLYSTYKTWRELMLLEYSLLLNRVTKSSIIRIIGVEVGDMPKEQVGPHLANIKSLIEQKSAIDVGQGMSEYTNPGPVENNIYVPTHNQIGTISTQQIGGDVNVTGLEDIDHFTNKFFSSVRIPKQFLGFCDDNSGFDGGTSLSIISSRYAKTIRRIQNTYLQALSDALNLMLIDKGLSSYVNKFELHMVAPTTREELDRQDAVSSKIQLTNDIMQLVASDVNDIETRLKILRSLLDNAIADQAISELLQNEINKYEEYKSKGIQVDETGEIIEQDDSGLTGELGGDSGGFDFGSDLDGSFGGGDFSGSDSGSESVGGSTDLPSPDSLGLDLTNNDI